MPHAAGPTQFAELNEVLRRLVDGACGALGDNFVGAYLVGSFALGDANMQSDCDFIVAVGGPIPAAQEEAIRRLHASFPPKTDTGTSIWRDRMHRSTICGGSTPWARDWLFVDHGHAEMEWSAHCNSPEHRWTLRHHGVVLTGPSPEDFAEVPSPPELVEQTRQFADYATQWVASSRENVP